MRPGVEGLVSGEPLDGDAFEAIRREMMLEHFKWDAQWQDQSVLARFPLIMEPSLYHRLSETAEALATETIAVEEELLQRPDLHAKLGISRPIRRVLDAGRASHSRGFARLMRFDFHPTTEGWLISEVNSDVPGGFIEQESFSGLVAECLDIGAKSPCGAGSVYTDAIARELGAGARVALVHATAYTDDRQVMEWIAARLSARGLEPFPCAPDHLEWRGGKAHLLLPGCEGPLGGVLRFFPGEWLANLSGREWKHFFHGSLTPLSNPATALLTQSKRLPLVWDSLKTPLETWRRTLPETRAPGDAPWRRDPAWLLKPAFGRVGEGIHRAGTRPAKVERATALGVLLEPSAWVAQRRFEPLCLETPFGPRRVCLGVYTIDQRAAGIYARVSPRDVIDSAAQDAALLVADHFTQLGAAV